LTGNQQVKPSIKISATKARMLAIASRDKPTSNQLLASILFSASPRRRKRRYKKRENSTKTTKAITTIMVLNRHEIPINDDDSTPG
jgi:hypothetical protein